MHSLFHDIFHTLPGVQPCAYPIPCEIIGLYLPEIMMGRQKPEYVCHFALVDMDCVLREYAYNIADVHASTGVPVFAQDFDDMCRFYETETRSEVVRHGTITED